MSVRDLERIKRSVSRTNGSVGVGLLPTLCPFSTRRLATMTLMGNFWSSLRSFERGDGHSVVRNDQSQEMSQSFEKPTPALDREYVLLNWCVAFDRRANGGVREITTISPPWAVATHTFAATVVVRCSPPSAHRALGVGGRCARTKLRERCRGAGSHRSKTRRASANS